MRQLKGGKTKESGKEKRERKKEFMENKERAFTIALPILGGLFLLLAIFVYIKTRPRVEEL